MEQTVSEPQTAATGSDPTTLQEIRIVADNARAPKRKATVVLPADTYVSIGQSVVFFAKDTEALIFFPNPGDLFESIKSNPLYLPLGEYSDKLVISPAAGAPGNEFPYEVYCSTTNDFADVGSAPRFIIE